MDKTEYGHATNSQKTRNRRWWPGQSRCPILPTRDSSALLCIEHLHLRWKYWHAPAFGLAPWLCDRGDLGRGPTEQTMPVPKSWVIVQSWLCCALRWIPAMAPEY